MCGLHSMPCNTESVRQLFRVSLNRDEPFDPLAANFRGHVAPVVRRGNDGDVEPVKMSWRSLLPQLVRTPPRVTTGRSA